MKDCRIGTGFVYRTSTTRTCNGVKIDINAATRTGAIAAQTRRTATTYPTTQQGTYIHSIATATARATATSRTDHCAFTDPGTAPSSVKRRSTATLYATDLPQARLEISCIATEGYCRSTAALRR